MHDLLSTAVILAVAFINGFFAIRAARSSHRSAVSSKEVQDKVGNGFASEVQSKLDHIKADVKIAKEQATEAKRMASGTNDQVRRMRSTVDKVSGKFDQHITEHNWDRRING